MLIKAHSYGPEFWWTFQLSLIEYMYSNASNKWDAIFNVMAKSLTILFDFINLLMSA